MVSYLASISRHKNNITEALASNLVAQKIPSHCVLLLPAAEAMEMAELTQSPSKDTFSVITNSAHNGTKGFTAADHAIYGKKKENQAWECFRGADKH